MDPEIFLRLNQTSLGSKVAGRLMDPHFFSACTYTVTPLHPLQLLLGSWDSATHSSGYLLSTPFHK